MIYFFSSKYFANMFIVESKKFWRSWVSLLAIKIEIR